MKSQQAQVAQLCKQYLKARGIKCRASSDSFSMGDSVTVTVYDQPPEIVNEIEAHFAQYQYGHFDGMEDIYRSDNLRRDIPQTKYLHVTNDRSDELKQAAWDWLRANWKGGDQLPENYSDGHGHMLDGEWATTMVHRLLGGALNGVSVSFWETRRKPAPVAPSLEGVRIEEHTHTKKGFQMFIVILPRVDRATFDDLLAKCRDAGGWYSRQWGTTPGGFAFRDKAQAEAFAAGHAPTAPTATPIPAPAPTANLARKFRDAADKLQTTIDDKFRDRLTNTPKRLAQAEHARLEGRRLERTQRALRALADLHKSGTVPPALQGIHTKADAYKLAASKTEGVSNGYHGYHVETGRPYYETPDALALWALLEGSKPDEKAEQLRRKINGLQFANIPGYFPTPAPVVQQMLDAANLVPGCSVLEPSAGHGAIADAAKGAGAHVTTYEVNYTLAEILALKGYAVNREDFTTAEPSPQFDRVLMNPPFEKLQDVDHVRHAFDFLKPGGRLVAIMSAGTFYNSTKRAAEFRDWLASIGGTVDDLPDGAFKESGTGVATRLIVLDKA